MALYDGDSLAADLIESGYRHELETLVAEINRQLGITWHLLDLGNLDATYMAWLR